MFDFICIVYRRLTVLLCLVSNAAVVSDISRWLVSGLYRFFFRVTSVAAIKFYYFGAIGLFSQSNPVELCSLRVIIRINEVKPRIQIV